MSFVKDIVRNSPLYRLVRRYRAVKSVSEWTTHDQEMLAFYSQFVGPGDLCFDVGANFGNRTKILLRLGARVIAVEPQRHCVTALRSSFDKSPHFAIVPKVLGASEGEAELLVGHADTISSLSTDWINAVQASGRFADHSWKRKQAVSMTTLDRLIAEHGSPVFLKIDVEGYEYEVLRGLSAPVRALSLEFTPELIETTFRCLDHLQSLGDISTNYAVGEEMRFALDGWVSGDEMAAILEGFRNDRTLFGDVYVRFRT